MLFALTTKKGLQREGLGNNMAKDIEKADYYDIYGDLLTKRQQEIMEMYYFSDLSLGEISEETGSTRQAAFGCIKRCEDRLAEFEKSLGLLEKRNRAVVLLTRLEELVKSGSSDECAELIKELREII